MKIVSRRTSLSVMLTVCTAVLISFASTVTAADQKMAYQSPQISSPSVTNASITMANLMDAYNRESNAREKYLAYAQKADQEKYHKVAELFRGAAKSEEIHLALYVKNITKLGGTPTTDIKTPMVKSTSENLAETINEIGDETGTLYPKYLAQAQADKIQEGIMSFSAGKKIRDNQKVIFDKAMADIGSWKKASGGFYVCKVCGNLTEKLDFAKCEVCGAPVTEFVKVK
jgi:rubrerythrin